MFLLTLMQNLLFTSIANVFRPEETKQFELIKNTLQICHEMVHSIHTIAWF